MAKTTTETTTETKPTFAFIRLTSMPVIPETPRGGLPERVVPIRDEWMVPAAKMILEDPSALMVTFVPLAMYQKEADDWAASDRNVKKQAPRIVKAGEVATKVKQHWAKLVDGVTATEKRKAIPAAHPEFKGLELLTVVRDGTETDAADHGNVKKEAGVSVFLRVKQA